MTDIVPSSLKTPNRNTGPQPLADAKPAKKGPGWLKLLPLALIGALVVVFFALGPDRFLNFDHIALQYAGLTAQVGAEPVWAAAAAIAIYFVVTAVSFPAAWLVTVVYGLIFGWAWATLYVVVGATLGAGVLYLVTRLALADFFRKRAGRVLNRMALGFQKDAVAYLLFLRLVPAFPFTLVNVVPAILGVSFPIFMVTTAIGIVPGTFAFAYAGEGLRSVVAGRAAACTAGLPPCGAALTPGELVTQQTIIAFGVLGLVSLLPVLLKRLRKLQEGA